jgi:16S rRNA (uracil1498-N3)-methyltransferase
MKQSLKYSLPIISAQVPFKKFITMEFNGTKLIASCEAERQDHLKLVEPDRKNTILLVGPEGDFTAEEMQMAEKNGYRAISLGESRLRTETAAIVACALVQSV